MTIRTLGGLRTQPPRQLDAVDTRQTDIEHGDVGRRAHDLAQTRFSVTRLRDDFDIGLTSERGLYPGSCERVILDDSDADHDATGVSTAIRGNSSVKILPWGTFGS